MKLHALALTAALSTVGVAATLPPGVPPLPSPVQAKTDMEKKIVEEVSGILDRFLGPGRSHVTVFLNVDVKSPLNGDSSRRKRTEDKDKKVESRWTWREISKKPKMSVLPGFNVAPDVSVSDNKKKAEAVAPPEAPADADDPDSSVYVLEVRKVLVSIVLDSSIPDKDVKMVEVMVSEVLGLDPDRGDHLNVYKLPLQPAWRWALETPDTLIRVFWGVAALVAFAMLLFFVARSIQSVLRARSAPPERPKSPAKGEVRAEAGAEARAGGDAAAAAQGAGPSPAEKVAAQKVADELARQHLDFVSADNFDMLAELLKDTDPKEIACVLGFIDPLISSRILDQFPQERRLETLMYMVSATSVPPQELAEIRRAWRERLAFAYGGTGAVGELLSSMDQTVQNAFLERLRAISPELIGKVSGALLNMEDIARLELPDLAHLAQSVQFEDWSRALHPLAPSYAERVLAVLPDASAKILRQWLTLTKPKKLEVEQAQAKVLAVMRSLIRQGRIALAAGPVPFKAPAAPVKAVLAAPAAASTAGPLPAPAASSPFKVPEAAAAPSPRKTQ
jgi:flagellar motor switch protein FliG